MITENDQKILDSLATILPYLTHLQKEKLLSFGEGMAYANNEKEYLLKNRGLPVNRSRTDK